ncbi:mechanosensitive ion channel family protein [bacterium]|nr:mechanosensitive ion channel family protein [bacterium]
MFEGMQEQTKIGIIVFAGMIAVFLIVLRLIRHSVVLREKVKGPLLMIFALLILYNIFYMLNVKFPPMVQPYYFAVLYLTVAVLLIRIIVLFLFDIFLVRTRRYRAPQLLKEISAVVLFGIVLVIIIQNTLKIQVTTLLATSALITVVLGLALQETLGNLFAGLALQLDQPYRQGDWIRVSDIFGRVEEVTWRATKLKTINNDYIIVPNGQIAKELVVNHSFPEVPHATRVNFSVNYSTSPNRVTRVVQQALAHVDNIIMEPLPEVRLHNFADFSITYEIKFFIRDFGLLEPTLAGVRKALWYHLRRDGIEIPFPIRNIYLHDRVETEQAREKTLKHLADTLGRVYLFASLDDEERHMIAEKLVEQRYAQDEIIIREGEQDESFFIIEWGTVEVYLLSAHGNRKILTTLAAGDFFGEIALLTGQKRTANVRALTDVRAHRLDKDSFKEILESKPDILDEIGSVLCRRKDQLDMLIAESSGPHEEDSINIQDAKLRILSRIRSYFGL